MGKMSRRRWIAVRNGDVLGKDHFHPNLRISKVSISHSVGGNPAAKMRGGPMAVADLCLVLGVLFAFTTLVLKIIEMARKD